MCRAAPSVPGYEYDHNWWLQSSLVQLVLESITWYLLEKFNTQTCTSKYVHTAGPYGVESIASHKRGLGTSALGSRLTP